MAKNKHNKETGSTIERSDERIKETQEVFTPSELVDGMVNEIEEEILKDLSKVFSKNPIEIDGQVYLVEEAVSDLINSLYSQCEKYKTQLELKN